MHHQNLGSNTYAQIRTLWNWSVKRGFVEKSPLVRLEPPPERGPRDRVLTDDELRSVDLAAPRSDYGFVVRLCIITGQRIGQLANFKREYLQGDLIVWRAEAMKANRSHVIPLTPMAKALIMPRHNYGHQRLFVCGASAWNKRKLDRTSAVTGWTHHDLRRTFSTGLARLRVAPHIKEMLLVDRL
jgi:integrase